MSDLQKDEQTLVVTKKRRGSCSASVELNNTAAVGQIAQIVSSNAQFFKRGLPKDDEEVADRINEFFGLCTQQDYLPTVEKLALCIGCDRTTLWEWEQGLKGSNPARANMIKKAKGIMAGIDAEMVQKGIIPQITYIFRAKNFYGMKDQQDHVIIPSNPLGDTQDAATLAQKYAATLPSADTPRLSGAE